MCESVWVGRSVRGGIAPVCVGGARVCMSLECVAWSCGMCVGGANNWCLCCWYCGGEESGLLSFISAPP